MSAVQSSITTTSCSSTLDTDTAAVTGDDDDGSSVGTVTSVEKARAYKHHQLLL